MKASAFLVYYLYCIKEMSWQSMIWPCKDTAVSMKNDVHCHPPCSSARAPEQGTRQSCVLLSAGYPQSPLCGRQSNKTGVIPACPSTCFFILYQVFCPFTTHTFPAADCSYWAESEGKTSAKWILQISISQFETLVWVSLGCSKDIEHPTHSHIQQHCSTSGLNMLWGRIQSLF